MSAERNGEIKMCPYWRRIFQSGEHVLALCGKESPGEPRLPDNELFPRLRKCPWYNARQAYEMPSILECHKDQINNQTGIPLEISGTNSSGASGIVVLEERWEREVEKFIQRHAQ